MIQIKEWERDAEDYNGKQHAEVFYVVVNGKEKAVGKADLLRMAKMTLPERGVSDEPAEMPKTLEVSAMSNGG